MRSLINPCLNPWRILVLGLFAFLTACGGGGGSGEPTPSGPTLDALFGRLTLNYKFDTDSTVFTDSVDFSSASLDSNKTVLAGTIIQDSSRFIGCTLNTVAGFNYDYLCIILDVLSQSSEVFAFDLAGRSVSNGIYEYCLPGVSIDNCSSDLLQDPDGIVLTSSGVTGADRVSPLGLSDSASSQSAKQSHAASMSDNDIVQKDVLVTNPVFRQLQEQVRALAARQDTVQ